MRQLGRRRVAGIMRCFKYKDALGVMSAFGLVFSCMACVVF